MFNANFASYPYVSPVNSYSENLGRAARSFIAALLAIDPGKVDADPSSTKVIANDNEAAYEEVESLARRFAPIMPNQAAELRYLLSRN
jgi:hypothetical protein